MITAGGADNTHRIWDTIQSRSTLFEKPGECVATTFAERERIWDALASHVAVAVTFEGHVLSRSTPLAVWAVIIHVAGCDATVTVNEG